MAKDSSKVWTVFSLVSALGAAAVAKKGLDKVWQLATGKQPPENPADPDVEIWEAVSWAVASGIAVGLARMMAQRKAASYYARSTGHLPPDLRKDGQEA
ncbi:MULTISPECIES: DUF4235 domain-containing protein [unclassified Nocardioides]|jgi:hypothetical protein|uniref:DUF4235 domain-containing protein n=1 Tax=Nocardioides sp. URHA0032 TaxID=1380388 RepID=UPI00048CE0A7|nr:DUF4235 domain-containing protein [Nocardioides sp. URHA0032]